MLEHTHTLHFSPVVTAQDCLLLRQVATMYAAMLSTSYATEVAFQKNFMESWRPLLKATDAAKHVKKLDKCDFSAIAAHLAEVNQAKKDLPAAEKKRIKAERDQVPDPSSSKHERSAIRAFCALNKRRRRSRPPSLFPSAGGGTLSLRAR